LNLSRSRWRQASAKRQNPGVRAGVFCRSPSKTGRQSQIEDCDGITYAFAVDPQKNIVDRKAAMLTKRSSPFVIGAALTLPLLASAAFGGNITFSPVPAPITDGQKRAVLSSQTVRVNGSTYPSGFKLLLRSGDELPRLQGTTASSTETIRYGTIIREDGTPLLDESTGEPAISNANDFNSLIEAGAILYLVSHFETRPGVMYLTLLDQRPDGNLRPVATRPIDFSGVKGGWVHCAGSVTPWGTHLGSEEYEPDARRWVDPRLLVSAYEAAMHGYFDPGGWRFDNNRPRGDVARGKAILNPYDYGWPVEVAVSEDGSTTVSKHFALGRSSNEVAYVMPDEKTVYITDDGTNGLLLMFVADAPEDLSAGILYAARWHQIEDNRKGGRARLSWVNLGHAEAGDIEAAIDSGTNFDDLFVYANEEPADCDYTTINTGHGAPYYECLDLKTGVDERVVSRLELRRYAALKGATSEFRKVEGFTYNPERRTAYVALSEINAGMLVASRDPARHEGGNDHIRLTREDCGAVYAMRIGNRERDAGGKLIESDYVAVGVEGLVAGRTVPGDPDNACDLDGIANPDNITYLPGYHSLVIGEDAGSGHQNDAVWSYDLLEGDLTRIQTTPYGSETTSVYWYPSINGHAYLMSVIQHPYGESDRSESRGRDDEYGYVGYFKFPALQ
jgi:secreted PhoX family phosphatase